MISDIVLAAAMGVGAAQVAGPSACDWRARAGQMKARLRSLKRAATPGRVGRMAGGLVVGLTLTGGGLLAYAAEPGAPERLPQEVVGVVGSGNQLSLKVAQDHVIKTVKLNDEYRDGWMLKALTPVSATLSKGAQIREVGLNPAGILARERAEQLRTVVQIAGADDAALLEHAIASGRWDGRTAKLGLSQEETRRLVVLQQKANERFAVFSDQIKAQAAEDGRPEPRIGKRGLDDLALLGGEAAEFSGLQNKEITANYQLGAELYRRLGPVQIPVPSSGMASLNSAYPGGVFQTAQNIDGVMVRPTMPDGTPAVTLRMPIPLSAQLYPVPDDTHPVAFQPTVLYPLPGASTVTAAQIVAASPGRDSFQSEPSPRAGFAMAQRG